MDDRKQFLIDREERLNQLARETGQVPEAKAFFNATLPMSYSYNFSWLGVPIIQYPQDIMAVQEIVWDTKPDLIIEAGIARGGSLLFYASLLKLLGNGGRVIGVDIDIRSHNRATIEEHAFGDVVTLIEGSSIAPETIEAVRKEAAGAKRVMVVLDSMHTADHVTEELNLYSPLVTKDCYLVVFDTVIEFMPTESLAGKPWSPGNSPFNSVEQFVQRSNRFEIDKRMDAKLQISVAPQGYLKCISD